jgi:hypothetical protein
LMVGLVSPPPPPPQAAKAAPAALLVNTVGKGDAGSSRAACGSTAVDIGMWLGADVAPPVVGLGVD